MERNQAKQLCEMMGELLKYCSSPTFDSKTFNMKCKNFTDLYKRCNYHVQGEYHDLWKDYLNAKTT